jgi:uncharacterized repeat protein (TIGR03803 family)
MLVITIMLVAFSSASLQARTVKAVHVFSNPPDGGSPWAPPIQDKLGNFYGTTWAGGTKGWGPVYKVDPAGKETILHSFVGGKDGAGPWAGLIMDAAGNLYGTTNTGGGDYCFNHYGCGVVFKLSHDTHGWNETILYALKGGSEGEHPGYGALARDASGNLYGTTIYGGTGYCSTGCGVVFKLTHTSGVWKEHVLHTFTAGSQTDGATPYGGLVLDAAGNVYGTTSIGGDSTSCGCGTVFKLDPSGNETILYNFAGGPDGAEPFAAIVRDSNGDLYGTTLFGGNNLSYGTVFKLDAGGTKTLLHTFVGYPSDGSDPYAPLVRDSTGNLYGTTYFGGNSSGGGFCETNNKPDGCGIVFKVSTTGKETVLHNFSYDVDGAEITAGVILDAKGNLYGGTGAGGPTKVHGGIVFELTK